MPKYKTYDWLDVKFNGKEMTITCNRKLIDKRKLILKSKDKKSKSDVTELLAMRFLSLNNISKERIYILHS